MKQESLARKIDQLRREKNAIILAHYYQEVDIQDIADFVGDSLGLSQRAANTDSDIIVFAGVHFMAETAKILNPTKRVLLPDLDAGCSLAESCPPEAFRAFVDRHINHIVISYINCSAEVKAMSDVICTSSNAEKIISDIPQELPVIFGPDKNLGAYLNKKLNRNMVLWDGVCIVHEAFSLNKIQALQRQHPGSILVAHPESESQILDLADFIGSTTAMMNFIKSNEAEVFIVATEVGLLHKLSEAVPDKTLIPAPVVQNTACACSECAFMKKNTLQKVYDCLLHETPEIIMDEELRLRALRPIEKMMMY